jgi:hypothetical protein
LDPCPRPCAAPSSPPRTWPQTSWSHEPARRRVSGSERRAGAHALCAVWRHIGAAQASGQRTRRRACAPSRPGAAPPPRHPARR